MGRSGGGGVREEWGREEEKWGREVGRRNGEGGGRKVGRVRWGGVEMGEGGREEKNLSP